MSTIQTQDLDHADFTEISTGIGLNPIHPGEILREEYLNPLGMSANALVAIALKVQPHASTALCEKSAASHPTPPCGLPVILALALSFG